MSDKTERRMNHALRRRIDTLVGRVHAARAEMVDRGFDAVHPDSAHRASSPKPGGSPATEPGEAHLDDERR